MALVRLEPVTPQTRDKHSTTESLCTGKEDAIVIYTHAKKKTTPIRRLFENKYRHDHVLITNGL